MLTPPEPLAPSCPPFPQIYPFLSWKSECLRHPSFALSCRTQRVRLLQAEAPDGRWLATPWLSCRPPRSAILCLLPAWQWAQHFILLFQAMF